MQGDLSNTQGALTALTIGPGANSVIGTVNGATDFQDMLRFTISSGFQLSSLSLFSYESTDAQGFFGVQTGSVINDPFTAGSYLGYTHFGTGAQNGSLPPVNLVGSDLLPSMGDNVNIAQGATGFTPPLGVGTYSFLIQQLGTANTSYRFDFNVTPVPEPRAQALIGGLCVGAFFVLRKRRSGA